MDGCQHACPLACPPACPPACPGPLLQRPRGAQYAVSSTIIIIIRFLFSFWVSCVVLRFAHLWYSIFLVACFSMLYLLCRSWAVVVDASARRFLGSWSGIDHF